MLEAVTLKDELRQPLLVIRQSALLRINRKKKWLTLTYDDLAGLYGEPEDWRCDGRVRNALTGWEARLWLLEDFSLWWKADEATHEGLLFTADGRTGAEWIRAMVADRTGNDGQGLRHLMDTAIQLQPSFKPHFRRIKTGARRITAGSNRLKEMGNRRLLEGLGVLPPEDDDPEANGAVPAKT